MIPGHITATDLAGSLGVEIDEAMTRAKSAGLVAIPWCGVILYRIADIQASVEASWPKGSRTPVTAVKGRCNM